MIKRIARTLVWLILGCTLLVAGIFLAVLLQSKAPDLSIAMGLTGMIGWGMATTWAVICAANVTP